MKNEDCLIMLSKRERVLIRFLRLYDLFGRYAPYFDEDSSEMLDEKMRVMDELEKGTYYRDIPGFFDILEKMKKIGE